MKKFAVIILLCLLQISTFAQTAIRGKLIDDETGEPMLFANVGIQGTPIGATSDFDGNFSLESPSLKTGSYNVQVSFVSYQTKIIEGVKVTTGQVTSMGEIRMASSAEKLQEVVIAAEAVKSSETAMLTMKKKSAAMLDGISSEEMKLIGDGTAGEAAKRVTGVTVEGGKYVYVRGLGDRYTKTTLNGVDIPGLDPDRNTIQMDIFPSNLIDNITISKNFTADLPADFTGGLLNVEIKDLPEQKIFSVSFKTAYNPSMHLNSNYLAYEGGSTDFLGFDDGTRALPAGADQPKIPTPTNGYTPQEVNDFVSSFSPTLGASKQTSLLDFDFGITFGNQLRIGKHKEGDETNKKDPRLGYILSLSYKSDYKFYDDVIYGEYQRQTDPSDYELLYSNRQTGQIGERSFLIGMLGGLAYKTNLSKIRLTAMRLQNGVSRAAKFDLENNAEAAGQSGYIAISDNLEYNERSLTNVLLNGKHVLNTSGWEVDWRVSPTLSTSEDPDIRKTAFTITNNNDTVFNPGAGGNPSRIWRYLSEVNLTTKIDILKKYKLSGRDAKLKFGIGHTYKYRDYKILFYDMNVGFGQSWTSSDPNDVLTPDNIYPNTPNRVYYQSGNGTPNPNEYQSNVNNTSAYVSNEWTVFTKLNTIVGVRVENYVQRHTGRDQKYVTDKVNGENLENEVVLESINLFPSLNLIYYLTENQNLRASYSRTIARPSFKELSFAQIIDPLTNRIFNGSLFKYSDWDGQLVSTNIDNIDLRWEMFRPDDQMYSVSLFYKSFDKPIELVRIPQQQTSTEYQARNVGNGTVLGVEFEIRQGLQFISKQLKNFKFNSNVTIIQSQITMSDQEYNSRKTLERTGETIKNTRQMAGQAPYVINAGIVYGNIAYGIGAGVFYNVKGPTLSIVGVGIYPDVYSEPFHSLNFSLNKKLGEKQNTKIEFKAENILNDRTESFFVSYEAQKQIFSSFNPGTTFSLGISHNF